MPFGLSRVSHVILGVDDVADSLAFYRDVLGMTVQSAGPNFAFLDGGGITLSLNDRGSGGAGCVEVVFAVDDVGAVHDELLRRGVAFRVEPRPVMRSGDRDLVAADFRDPDGHVLSITGWVAVAQPASGPTRSR